jgi:hypothetical protein
MVYAAVPDGNKPWALMLTILASAVIAGLTFFLMHFFHAEG